MSRLIKSTAVSKVRLAALGVPFALVLVACGGGGGSSTTSTTTTGGGLITGIGGGGGPAVAVTTETGTKLTFVGTCTSVQGGVGGGYELGLCYTAVAGPALAAEALFQDRAVSVTQSAANPISYSVSLPGDWNGPVTLLEGELLAGKSTTQKGDAQLADLFGVGVQKCLPSIELCTISATTQAPTAQSTIFDMSYGLGLTTRSISYGIWAHTPKVSTDYYYGGFSTSAPGQAKTLSSILNSSSFTGTGDLTYKGNVGAWIMSQQSALKLGANAAGKIASDITVTVNKATGVVTGTISNIRSTGLDSANKPVLVNESIANMTFSATLNRTDGTFVGSVSGSNKLRVKGAVYGTNGDQISGQIAGTASDNRVLSGAFGAKL